MPVIKDFKKPDFLVVGVAKSGTTSLFHYLKTHPQIFLPDKKEPLFFISDFYRNLNKTDYLFDKVNERIVFNINTYKKLFASKENNKIAGEFSVLYLYFYHLSIPNIKKYLVDVKIVIILRNPVERAFSAYRSLVGRDQEKLSFDKALNIESQRIEEKLNPMYYYLDQGFYFEQVKAFMDSFNNVKIYLFDELKTNPAGLLSDLYNFLDIDDKILAGDFTRRNVSYTPKSKLLHNIITMQNKPKELLVSLIGSNAKNRLKKYIRSKNSNKLVIEENTKRELINIYSGDIKRLEPLIGKNLSSWTK